MTYADTEITGGHISTNAVGPDGRQAKVDFYNTAQHDVPTTPHTVVTAADGSQWYQVASGEGMGAFYATPHSPEMYPRRRRCLKRSQAHRTALCCGRLMRVRWRPFTRMAAIVSGTTAAYFQEPDAPHETIQGADGLSWYAMTPAASVPQFEPVPDGGSGAAERYNQALFGQFYAWF